MTFQTWKMVFLNSMTFHDQGASCFTHRQTDVLPATQLTASKHQLVKKSHRQTLATHRRTWFYTKVFLTKYIMLITPYPYSIGEYSRHLNDIKICQVTWKTYCILYTVYRQHQSWFQQDSTVCGNNRRRRKQYRQPICRWFIPDTNIKDLLQSTAEINFNCAV